MSGGTKFLVACCPRSGAAYAARLLTNLGVECGHESFFRFKPRWHVFLESESSAGDASWLSVPFLREAPHRVRILHQTRDPLKVVRSLMELRFFDLGDDGQPVRQGLGVHFTQFAFQHCPALLECRTSKERAMWFYLHWNKMVEEACAARETLRYGVEMLDADQLRQILNHLGVAPERVPDEVLTAHYELLPRNVNAKTREKTQLVDEIEWKDLPGEVQELAKSYGYGPTSSAGRVVGQWTDAVRLAEERLRKHAQTLENSRRAERTDLFRETEELGKKLERARETEQTIRRELDALLQERVEEQAYRRRGQRDGRDAEEARRARTHWMCVMASGSRVLDAASGDGARALLLAREGVDVTALDVDTAAIRAAQASSVQGSETVQKSLHIVNGTLASPELKSKTFDTVILADLPARVTRSERLLSMASAQLVDEGRVVISVPLGFHPSDDCIRTYYGWDLLSLVGQFFNIVECDVVHDYLCVVAAKPKSGECPQPPSPTVLAAWIQKAGAALAALQQDSLSTQRQLQTTNDRLTRTREALESECKELRDGQSRLERELEAATATNAAVKDLSAATTADIDRARRQKANLEGALNEANAQLETTRKLLARAQALHVRLVPGSPKLQEEAVTSLRVRASGPIDQEGGVLFFSTNGAGLGHLTRSLAVARRIRRVEPTLPVYFLTSSPALHVISRENLLAYHIPSPSEFGGKFSSAQWNNLLLRTLRMIIATHRPSALIYDGVSPFRGLLDVIPEAGFVYTAMVLRLRHKHDRLQSMTDKLDMFDELLFPGERDVAVPPKLDTLRHQVFGPILYLDREELLSREQARAHWRFSPDSKVVYVQLGAGNINDTGEWFSQILAALQKRADVEVVVGQSPVSKTLPDFPRGVHTLAHYPNSRYFNCFDLAVSAVGYNTFHELMHFGVPSVLVPNQETVTDDQVARAQVAQAASAARVVLEPTELERAINDLLCEDAARAARAAAMELVPDNDAMTVARHVLASASARIEDRLAVEHAVAGP